MQELTELQTNQLTDEDLHLQANKYFRKSQDLVFQVLPTLIGQLIESKAWNTENSPKFKVQ